MGRSAPERASGGRGRTAVLLLTALACCELFPGVPAAGQQRGTRPIEARRSAPRPDGAALRSLLVPGWGQYTLDQRRGWLYGLAEAGLWVLWANRRSAVRSTAEAYRTLAWNVARLRTGARSDGDWAYYEALSKWIRSGTFDADSARPGLQPEQDPATFNGSVWQLAVGLFGGGGDTKRALTYYETHAYGDAFLWDWTGKSSDLARYRDLIHQHDRRAREVTAALGAVLANHVLSAVDAFLSARLPGRTDLGVVPDGTRSGAWLLTLRFSPP